MTVENAFKNLPSVETLARHQTLVDWEAKLAHPFRVRLIRDLLQSLREEVGRSARCPDENEIVKLLRARVRKFISFADA